ncbi:hypothetical protein V8G54_015552 [Vigna mungo]|uniref:Uncharacterized protein n=1 Tax=Vigna mungo TaxID=3915 RepID=A0AAQ3NKG4_VIGMU
MEPKLPWWMEDGGDADGIGQPECGGSLSGEQEMVRRRELADLAIGIFEEFGSESYKVESVVDRSRSFFTVLDGVLRFFEKVNIEGNLGANVWFIWFLFNVFFTRRNKSLVVEDLKAAVLKVSILQSLGGMLLLHLSSTAFQGEDLFPKLKGAGHVYSVPPSGNSGIVWRYFFIKLAAWQQKLFRPFFSFLKQPLYLAPQVFTGSETMKTGQKQTATPSLAKKNKERKFSPRKSHQEVISVNLKEYKSLAIMNHPCAL